MICDHRRIDDICIFGIPLNSLNPLANPAPKVEKSIQSRSSNDFQGNQSDRFCPPYRVAILHSNLQEFTAYCKSQHLLLNHYGPGSINHLGESITFDVWFFIVNDRRWYGFKDPEVALLVKLMFG